MTNREEKARELFLSGRNCAQSVFMAYAPLLGLEEKAAAAASAGFGGGIGRMRGNCGAFSAMVMVLPALVENGSDPAQRPALYALVQEAHRRFVARLGTDQCAVLLGKPPVPEDPTPDPRTAEYYAKRPCAGVVSAACALLEELIEESGVLGA